MVWLVRLAGVDSLLDQLFFVLPAEKDGRGLWFVQEEDRQNTRKECIVCMAFPPGSQQTSSPSFTDGHCRSYLVWLWMWMWTTDLIPRIDIIKIT